VKKPMEEILYFAEYGIEGKVCNQPMDYMNNSVDSLVRWDGGVNDLMNFGDGLQ